MGWMAQEQKPGPPCIEAPSGGFHYIKWSVFLILNQVVKGLFWGQRIVHTPRLPHLMLASFLDLVFPAGHRSGLGREHKCHAAAFTGAHPGDPARHLPHR